MMTTGFRSVSVTAVKAGSAVHPRDMYAVYFQKHGDSDVLETGRLPVPSPSPHEVLIRVEATSVNRLDIAVRKGFPGLSLGWPHIPGSDAVGRIESTGNEVTGCEPGQRVVINPGIACGRCNRCLSGKSTLCDRFVIVGEQINGAYAEYVTVPSLNIKRVPADFPLIKAAAAPLAYITAWHSLVTRAGLKFGDRVLVSGGSGGVSTAAIQIARLFDAHVVATTRAEEKAERLRGIGASEVIVTGKPEGWAKSYMASGGRPFDIVIDSVGSALWKDNMRLLGRGGRLVNYGRTSGGEVSMDLSFVFWKQLQVIGSTMGDPGDFETVMNLIFSRKLDPVVDRVFPLREAAEAQDYLEASRQTGKVVLLNGERNSPEDLAE